MANRHSADLDSQTNGKIINRRSWNYKKKAGASSGEVVELRHQLRQLTDELHSLRSNLRGSVPDFLNTSSFETTPQKGPNLDLLTSIRASAMEISPKETVYQKFTPEKVEKPEEEKPPLPPRLYRPPPKPERTFQADLCTDLSRVLHDIDQGNGNSLSANPQIVKSMPVFAKMRRPVKPNVEPVSDWKYNNVNASIQENPVGGLGQCDPMLNMSHCGAFAPPPQTSSRMLPARRFASNGSLNSAGMQQQQNHQQYKQFNGNMNHNNNNNTNLPPNFGHHHHPPPLPPKSGMRNSPSNLRVSMPQLMPQMLPQPQFRGSRMFQSIRENTVTPQKYNPNISASDTSSTTLFSGLTRIRPNPNSPFSPYKGQQQMMQSPVKPNPPPVQCKSLTRLPPPLTLNSVVKEIKEAFESGTCWFDVGPVTLFVNPYNDIGSSVTLTSVRECPAPLVNVCKRLHEGFRHSENSQSVVLSGASSSGKSYICMQLLRQLYVQFGGRGARDAPAFTTLAAATTVLTSLTCARADNNDRATQTAFLYEMHVVDDVPAKTKLFCCFTDLTRLTRQTALEGNFNIFHEMIAGLTAEEKAKFHLTGVNECNLRYLHKGGDAPAARDPCRDQHRFLDWTQSLSALGIPFSDVMRLLAAVLLLGNVQFVHNDDAEIDLKGQKDLESVAALLGVSGLSLYKTFTRRVKKVKDHEITAETTADYANRSRDALAQSLYYRCVSAIVRRANSIKCGPCTTTNGSNGAVSSSDGESSSVQDSGIGLTQSQTPADQSPTSSGQLNSSKTSSSQQTEGIVSVFDCFAESDSTNKTRHSLFDDLCKNIAIEKVHNFFQTQVFDHTNALIAAECTDTLINDAEFTFENDALNLLFLPNSGLLCLLDTVSLSATSEGIVQSCKKANKGKKCLELAEDGSNFTLCHYGNRWVTYDPVSFPQTNRDELPTDLARIFAKQSCNFGFASYFFSNDLKSMAETKPEDMRHSLRIMGSCGAENSGLNDGPGVTLMQDFTSQIDTFVKALNSTKPTFIHCIKPNCNGEYRKFDETVVKPQVQRLDILPTLDLIGQGFPYYKTMDEFNNRYRFLAVKYHHDVDFDSNHSEESKLILDCYLKAVDDSNLPYVSNQWVLGNKHVFLSQGALEQLEILKKMFDGDSDRDQTVIRHLPDQTVPNITSWLQNSTVQHEKSKSPETPDRPKPIVELNGACDKVLKKATSILGIDLSSASPPPLPATRQYVVNGEKKLNFPQRRVLTQSYKDASMSVQLKCGEVVTAVGCASKPKHILVDLGKGTIVPIPTNITRLSTK